MENDCYCERCTSENTGTPWPKNPQIKCAGPWKWESDPRVPVVREIIARLSIPRTYAGDWPRDMAERILTAIDKVENNDN